MNLELFDGTDTILANYWDWTSGKVPEVNSVVDVVGNVTEWSGNKQLTIMKLTNNTEVSISSFTPKSDYNIYEVYKDCYALASDISDPVFNALCTGLLDVLISKWQSVPGAKSVHHAYLGGTLIHSYSVACIAKAIAEKVEGANVDLCVAGGLLRDIGKLYTYTLDKANITFTDDGLLFEHVFIGAEFVGNFADEIIPMSNKNIQKVAILRHIILSHHGSLEFGSPVLPACIEAHIVHHADALDAAAESIRTASKKCGEAKWTERIWSLGNGPSLSTKYVESIMQKEEIEENLQEE